jgi:hypothetical protein
MAQFCTKCGSPMGDGMQFCTICGATVGGPPAAAPSVAPIDIMPPAPIAVAPPVAPVLVTPPVAPGAKKGSPVLKIVLIILGVFILLGMLGIGSCVYVAYRAKQKYNRFEKEVRNNFPSGMGSREDQPSSDNPGENPGGMSNPGAGPAVDMGELAYPGATAGQSANQSIFGAAGFKMQEYFTSDSVDTVVAYYKNKLGNRAMSTQTGDGAVMQVGGGGALTTINIAPDSASGKTKISISSFHKQ